MTSASSWNWNGSRWWKIDFHTHTPASEDYGKGAQQDSLRQRTPREWLLDYMRAGIDCVAITDHNTGAWVDRLRTALRDLESERPEGFRRIYLYPGVEISVSGGVHVLALLDRDATTADVDTLLGAVGFTGRKGATDSVTSKAFGEVAAEIRRAHGIVIPAHVDGPSGLLTSFAGQTLAQAVASQDVLAMEVCSPSEEVLSQMRQGDHSLALVLGSDAHHPHASAFSRAAEQSPDGDQGVTADSKAANVRWPGSHYTWVKMGQPTLDGLRLALLDGPLSIQRSDGWCSRRDSAVAGDAQSDPNEHASLVIEGLEISDARYIGRAKPFALQLNPWLNAIVGGRGTGKSTIVEFLRIALRRTGELPDPLKDEFEKYARVYSSREDGGLLTEDAAIRVTYRKNGARFRIQWEPKGRAPAIEEETDSGWRIAEGDISQRFPVRIYSQKQIFHLANAPLALLRVVDEAPAVDRRSWQEKWKAEEARYLSLRAKAREIEAGLAEEPRLRGELDDVRRRLAIFEEAGHADVLKEFQRRSRQRRAVEAWEELWSDTGDRIREVAFELLPDPLDQGNFDPDASEDTQLRKVAEQARSRLRRIQEALEELSGGADEAIAEWRSAVDASDWRRCVDAALAAYEALKTRLADEGAGDPSAYGELVQRRQTLERRLDELHSRRKQVGDLHRQAKESMRRLVELRRTLTGRRADFLGEVLRGNRFVRIQVVPYGARHTAEHEFRRLLQRDGGGFERDIGSPGGAGMLGRLYCDDSGVTSLEPALADIKEEIRTIAEDNHDPSSLGDRRFATHLSKLPPEALDRLDLWFPEDSLDVQYSTSGDGQRFRSIQEGSPGQKTAALLAFLMSYGDEPLVLDQPEDDLDNHLIYDLIVTQIREVKRRRQIIVVTHNANIVVNGDAELVVALVARGGQTRMECDASLQDRRVRDTICDVMEGGRLAFEQRYRRIALDAGHV